MITYDIIIYTIIYTKILDCVYISFFIFHIFLTSLSYFNSWDIGRSAYSIGFSTYKIAEFVINCQFART